MTRSRRSNDRLRTLRGSAAMRVATLLAGLACALTTLAPSTCIAAPKPDAALEDAAKARYAEGFRLYSKKRYEEARVAFLQATALKRRPATSFMLAQSSLRAKRWLDALREFDAYVADVGGDVPAKLRELVDAGRQAARQHVGQLRFLVPEGAEVTIDGARVADIGALVDVAAGTHAVVITHRDEQKIESVDATPGAIVDVKPVFVPKALIPTSDTRSRPTPPPVQPSSVATSLLAPPATTWPLYTAGAVGLGGLAAAAIFGGLHANAQHAIDVSTETLVRRNLPRTACDASNAVAPELTDVCRTLRRNEKLARSYETPATASLIVGLAGSAIAIGWFLLAPKERADKPSGDGARVVPWVGASAGGAIVQGRF